MSEKPTEKTAPPKKGGKKGKRALLPHNGFKKILKRVVGDDFGIGAAPYALLAGKMKQFIEEAALVMGILANKHAGRKTLKMIDLQSIQIEEATLGTPRHLQIKNVESKWFQTNRKKLKGRELTIFPLSPIKKLISSVSGQNCGADVSIRVVDLMIWSIENVLVLAQKTGKHKRLQPADFAGINFPSIGLWGSNLVL